MTTRYRRSIWCGSRPAPVAIARSRVIRPSLALAIAERARALELGGDHLLHDPEALGEELDDLAVERFDTITEGGEIEAVIGDCHR